MSEAIAEGEEQSIRMRPSQSSVMKPKAGSTRGLTTVRSRPQRSAMRCQKSTAAPPSGSTPMRTPAERIASRSTTEARSST